MSGQVNVMLGNDTSAAPPPFFCLHEGVPKLGID